MEVLNKEKLLEQAKRLIDEGKLDKAIAEYKKLLELDPKDMRIKLRVAELLARQKNVTEAVRVYNEVADCYSADGFYLKAVTVYKNVLRLNPSIMEVNYRLAELYEKMGLAKDAIYQYQILSSTLEQKGDYASLTDVRKKMVELDPHNVSSRFRLAETYQYQGKEEEAIGEYAQLVVELKKEGNISRLVDLYEKILAYRPENLEMIRELCKLYHKRGEWKNITAFLAKSSKLTKDETDLLIIEGEAFAHLNQVETAKNRYRHAAEIFIDMGKVDEALNCYREMLVLSPEDEEVIRELVAEIDADYFSRVKAEADEKRTRIEERAQEEVVADEDGEGEENKTAIPKTTLPKTGSAEARSKLMAANAAFELGKAYMQMGLKSEAVPELEKAIEAYRSFEGSGAKDPVITANMEKIMEWLDLVPEKVQAKTEKPVERPSEKKIEEKKEKPEAKKKKDKRVGFV